MNTLNSYPELQNIMEFIRFIINIIQWGTGTLSSLVVVVTGWQILTSKDVKPLSIAKENFNKAIWALFFVFAGSNIANFFVGKMYNLLAG